MDSMITTFNTAVTETAGEIPGKHRQRREKKTWITADIFDLCDKRGAEESDKYTEGNSNIKRSIKRQRKTEQENSVVRLKKI